jgi:lipopolysaccharide/colanic/teichoic acid biosynthesis glycosyltransferase
MPDGGVVAESGRGAGGAGGPLVPPAEATCRDDAASPLPSPRQDDRSPGALLRRSIDAVGAALLLALLAPSLLAVALMLRAESGASVLARRRVVGRGGGEFTLLTFRLDRATLPGQWLGATGIADLPMLLNVLRGEMGLVGPAPTTRAELAARGIDPALASLPGMISR